MVIAKPPPLPQVEMLVTAPLKCPISLDSPPLCPQITPCGHVFSFPAIMAHLLNHGGDALRKASPCPLCNAPVVARELRLVRAHTAVPPQVSLATNRRHYPLIGAQLELESSSMRPSHEQCVGTLQGMPSAALV